jgi:hypothetical protein
MPDKKWTAIFGVLVMLVAAVGPVVGAAAPASSDATTAIDGNADFAISSDNETTNDTNTTDGNETDVDENATTENATDFNATSSTAAANEFAAKLQQVVANATNDSNVSAPGLVIASYAVANNPGNAPDHAGPPNGTPGANVTNNSSGGPPNGTTGGAADGNETDGSDGAPDNGGDNGNGNGPNHIVAASDAAADFAVETALAVSATSFDA